jgi:hypothetical protein
MYSSATTDRALYVVAIHAHVCICMSLINCIDACLHICCHDHVWLLTGGVDVIMDAVGGEFLEAGGIFNYKIT